MCWSRLGLVSRTDVNDAVTTNRATAESRWSSKPRGQARETGAFQPEGGGTQRRQPRKAARRRRRRSRRQRSRRRMVVKGKLTNGYERDPDKGTFIVPLTALEATERRPRELMR